MIRTDSDEYFIEPLERGTQELEDQGRVHVVYRRSALLQNPTDASVDYQPPGTMSPAQQLIPRDQLLHTDKRFKSFCIHIHVQYVHIQYMSCIISAPPTEIPMYL